MSFSAKYRVVAKIDSVYGKCPVYKGGEKIVMEDGLLNLQESDAVCLQLLATLIHEYMVKQHRNYWESKETIDSWDYSKEKTKCPRVGPPLSEGYVVVSFDSIPKETK